MAGHGGKRKGSGRKTKAEEQKVNKIFLKALKELYNKHEDEEAKVAFVKELCESQRGQIFVAEHLFGKPKEMIENINHNIPSELTNDEIKALKSEIFGEY